MKEMKKWLALLAIAALMLSLGGCGGSSNSGGSSNNGGSGSSPSDKTYTGTNGTVTATDASGNTVTLKVTNASLTVGTIPSTGSVTVADQSTTASFSCTLSDDKGNTRSISRSETVTVTQSGSVWTFAFSENLNVILNTSSMKITLGEPIPSVTIGGTSYTLTDFTIDVEDSSNGGDDDDSSGSDEDGGGVSGSYATTEEVAALLDTITDGALPVSQAANPVYTVDLNSLTASVSAAGAVSTATTSTSLQKIDLVWHVDPSRTDEFYTVGTSGNELSTDQLADIQEYLDDCAVYIARDIRYANSDWNFNTDVTKDEDNEVGCLYTASGYTNYIFATLPSASDKSAMTHTAKEAYNTPVLHIHKAGTYNLKGTWNGQIWVDAEDDATVTLNLNGLTVNCSTGPGLVFCDGLYECDGDADESTASWDVSAKVKKAGANVVLTGTNSVTGGNLYRILKAEAKSGYTADGKNVGYQKKRYKVDGAFHSMVSMNIGGTGSLTVKSTTCEGMDSEMHLTINGGAVTVTAPDDAINVNEDGISVFTMNAGTLTATGTTNEGDGIDSNGYIVVNGGTVKATAGGSGGTAGLDADYSGDYDRSYGIYINGGTTTTNGTMGKVYENGGTLNNTGGSNNNQPGGGGQPGSDTPPDLPNANGNGGPAMHR